MTDTDREQLLTAIRSAIAAAPNADSAMTQTVRLLKDAIPYYTWVGIYVMRRLGERPANVGFVIRGILGER